MSKRKSNNLKGNMLDQKTLQNYIVRFLKRNPNRRYNTKQISKKLKIANNIDSVQSAIDAIVKKNLVQDLGDFKYKLGADVKPSNNHKTSGGDRRPYTGKVDMTKTGSAYIVIDGKPEDVFIHNTKLNGALHGDTVRIEAWTPRGRRKPEGEVVEIIKRAKDYIVGTYNRTVKQSLVVPKDERINFVVEIPLKFNHQAKDGDIVVAYINDWPSIPNQNPSGRITSVLGDEDSSDVAMKSILVNNGFDLDFGGDVLDETDKLPDVIDEAIISKRRDMRQVTTITIDPLTAKDFDDALSIEWLDNSTYEVGIHIADVSHYVKPGTALDKEAFSRSTSVYLVDRVLPMLPERISNDLCSLRPQEESLTFSAVFTFDKSFQILKRWFGKTVIFSDKRFAYEEAQEILEAQEGEYHKELKQLNKLAVKLRKKRFKKGSIDFDSEEVNFLLDDDGIPKDVFVKKRLSTHKLVEELMLLANREVATYMHKRGAKTLPFVYRVHDLPDLEKVQDFANFAKQLGISLDVSTPDKVAVAYNRLTEKAKTDETLKLLEPIMIRTMAKAIYTTENIGHYGLGFDYYTHFTSPIRRYADVLVHRILFDNLEKEKITYNQEKLEDQCKHISSQERNASSAERESIKYKQVEFIKQHLGETFEGIVSGIIDRGFFVEIAKVKAEGLVGFETLNEPFDVLDSKLQAIGKHSGTSLSMGQRLVIKVVGANLEKVQIDMELVTLEVQKGNFRDNSNDTLDNQ